MKDHVQNHESMLEAITCAYEELGVDELVVPIDRELDAMYLVRSPPPKYFATGFDRKITAKDRKRKSFVGFVDEMCATTWAAKSGFIDLCKPAFMTVDELMFAICRHDRCYPGQVGWMTIISPAAQLDPEEEEDITNVKCIVLRELEEYRKRRAVSPWKKCR